MRRPSLVSQASLVAVCLIAASSTIAANAVAASDSAKRPSNSFNLYVTPAPAAVNGQPPAQGVGIASGKAVIIDPYKVPLIQNAGSLTPGR